MSSNEPIDGVDDGNTFPDWKITGPLSVNLRAERSGAGTGRIYTIQVESRDAAGNTTLQNVTVSVPLEVTGTIDGVTSGFPPSPKASADPP